MTLLDWSPGNAEYLKQTSWSDNRFRLELSANVNFDSDSLEPSVDIVGYLSVLGDPTPDVEDEGLDWYWKLLKEVSMPSCRPNDWLSLRGRAQTGREADWLALYDWAESIILTPAEQLTLSARSHECLS